MSGLGINNMLKACNEQYDGRSDWYDDFHPPESNLADLAMDAPKVQAFEGVPDYLAAASLLLNVNAALTNWNSHYYYFNLGISLGSFLGGSIANFDKWFELGIIDETSPWERYNP